MHTSLRTAVLTIASALTISLTLAGAQNGAQFAQWKPTALADSVRLTSRTACQALISQTGYDFSITRAVIVPESKDAPEYCQVRGQVLPEVQFEVSLPASWNGRLYMFGNGGFAGESIEAGGRLGTARRAMARGFAVAQTNTGHSSAVEPLGTFAANSQKFLDYAYRAVHVTVLTAKRLVDVYYQQPARYSYFDGCSTGGRQGLISAQRFPDDFDGIVVGAPVLDFVGTMISYQRMQRAMAAAPITPDNLKVLAAAVNTKCDARDGVTDGVIDNPRACAFSPSADLPRCADGDDGAACFTAAQVRTLETIFSATTRDGSEIYPAWPVGMEVAAPNPGGESVTGWAPWLVAAPQAPRPVHAVFGETFFQNMAFGRVSPTYDWSTFDLERDYDKLQFARAALDATDPDLSRFKARGGKILSYFGWADAGLNPMMGVKYYEQVMQRFGAETPDFYRLFMVPGMFHCRGGVGPDTFDAVTPLVEWVEKNTPPATIIASKMLKEKVVRTRPLCPYPQAARYRGTGSTDDAANFACETAK